MAVYSVVLDPAEEGGYNVSVPALPGCFTHGATVEQCVERAKEAIAVYLEDVLASGEPLPIESEAPRVIRIEVGEAA